jgi:hypothetical protein
VDGASRSAFDDTSASSSARWRLCCLALIPSLGHGGDRCIGSGGGWGRVFNPDRPDRTGGVRYWFTGPVRSETGQIRISNKIP